MYLVELFQSNDNFLSKANSLLLTLNKSLNESASSIEHQKLLAQRDTVLEYIRKINNKRLLENYAGALRSVILDNIIAVKARGVDRMPLSVIQKTLSNSGFDVDIDFLVDFISNIEGVQEVVPGDDAIIFNTQVERGVSDDEAAAEKQEIEKTATKVAKDNIEKGNTVPKSVEIK